MFTTNNKCLGGSWVDRENIILSKCKTLVIKDYSLTEFDNTLEDFIHNFLVSYNQKYKTASLGDLGRDQCSTGRLRSLADIFMICKHYFPSCTLEEVKDALYANINMLSTQVCSTIHKRVYWIRHNSTEKRHEDSVDEFGLKFNNYLK